MNDMEMTTEKLTREEWDEIARRLREPFDPGDVDFRVQGKASEQTGKAQVVAYIDARAVQDRLDAVVGAGNWSFDWQPLVIDKGEVMVAKGIITVYGVSKADAGSASNFEQSLGAVSHCFKRAAVHWGIGRYLYNLPMAWVAVERGGRIPEPVLRELRAKLPRPGQQHAAALRSVDDERSVRTIREAPAAAPREAPVRAPSSDGLRPHVVPVAGQTDEQMATEKQLASIRKLCEALGKPQPESEMTYARAREMLSQLSGEYQRARRAS
ncbi:MAG TPA: Rad52/Rad22 family DNA repair protein [Ktedonobacterales bacterium]|nr:Rad52/Rad22 family DNA repair protein [Ktedonobacterales bacterium]